MGTISSALDSRPVRTAAIIGAEDEAIRVAHAIAAVFDVSGSDAGTAEARLDLLSRSGLFGISVPTEHGGIDVSNTTLAAVCAEAAAHSATLAEILAAHFVVVENLRGYGTEGQRNVVFSAVLAGARLARGAPRRNGEEADALALAASGVAFRLSGEVLCTPCTRHADWVLVPARVDGGKPAGLLLPARIEGLRYVANTCEPASGGAQPAEHVLFKDVLVDGDTLLHSTGDAPQLAVAHSLELLLEASRQLGAGRRAFRRFLENPDIELAMLGLFSARLAAADAMIAEAGRTIDAAQIGLADQHRTNAFLAAASALAIAQEALGHLRSALGTPDSTSMSNHASPLAAALQEIGRLRLDAHRNPPEEEL